MLHHVFIEIETRYRRAFGTAQLERRRYAVDVRWRGFREGEENFCRFLLPNDDQAVGQPIHADGKGVGQHIQRYRRIG